MENLVIKKCTSCWGDEMYFGFVNRRQYTEGYEAIEGLIEDNPEFASVNITE